VTQLVEGPYNLANPVGIVNMAGSKGPSTSCVTHISLMESMLFLRAIGQRNCFQRSYFPLSREASFRLPLSTNSIFSTGMFPSCQKGMGMDSLICGLFRSQEILVSRSINIVGHHLLSIRF